MAPSAPRAAKPTKDIFDAFNSSATGHQRAENRLSGSTLWRDSRHTKLRDQFGSGAGGGKRIADTVGAGSDGSVKMGLLENGTVTWKRERDQLSMQECLKVRKNEGRRMAKRVKLDQDVETREEEVNTVTPEVEALESPVDLSPSSFLSPIDPNTASPPNSQNDVTDMPEQPQPTAQEQSTKSPLPKQIFANLTFYINGSTAPLISDHKLKHLLTTHGGRVSIALGRRTVTHVILSRPGSAGGGGGLSGSKIHKEITNKRGESVKYVTAEWVLESIKAEKRLPEARFEALRLAPNGVRSAMKMFGQLEKVEDGAG